MLRSRFVAEYFKEVEAVLAAHHSITPRQNAVDKGEDREALLVATLNRHLPAVARAHRGGVVIDCRDRRSSQTDIVGYANWSPMLGQQRKPTFLAHGVFAAIEVKSTLTIEALEQAQTACVRLKRLRKFLYPPEEAATIVFSKTAPTICVGLFAYKTRIKSADSVLGALRSFEKRGIKNSEMLDFVCVNQEYCMRRHRTEDADGFISKTNMAIETYRNECRYFLFSNAFARMLESILNYVSYIGPFREQLSPYLDHWAQGEVTSWSDGVETDFSAAPRRAKRERHPR